MSPFAVLALVRLSIAAVEPPAAPPVDLTWRAPGECPDTAAVLDMVSALLRRPPGAVEPERAAVRATVARNEPAWELRLELHTRGGAYQRDIAAESCSLLARAAALLIAVHLDPLAVSRGLEPPAVVPPPEPPLAPPLAPPPAPPPVVVVPPPRLSEKTALYPPELEDMSEQPSFASPANDDMSEETAISPAPPRRRPPVLAHVRVDGGLDVGVLPGVGGHVGLFAGATLPRLRLEAGIVGVPLRLAPARDDLPGGRFDRLLAVVRVCPTWRPREVVALGLCLGAEAGAIRGIGRQVVAPNSQWAPSLGFTLGPAVRWQLTGPLGLWFGVDGVLAVNRPTFTVRAGDEVFTGGRAGLRATFGVDLQFGARNR